MYSFWCLSFPWVFAQYGIVGPVLALALCTGLGALPLICHTLLSLKNQNKVVNGGYTIVFSSFCSSIPFLIYLQISGSLNLQEVGQILCCAILVLLSAFLGLYTMPVTRDWLGSYFRRIK